MTKHTPEPYFIEDQGEIKAVCGPTLHTLVMRDMVSAGALRDALNAAYAKGQENALNTHAALRASHAEMVEACELLTTWANGLNEHELSHLLNPTLDEMERVGNIARTALSNAAKVEVGHE